MKFALGLSDTDFRTEEDVRNDRLEGTLLHLTPDVLFREPQEIMRRTCYWAESKRAVVVPGLSPEKIVRDIKCQTDKYIEAFGPGLILWNKLGFDQGIVDALSADVLHVTPIQTARDAESWCIAMLSGPPCVGKHSHSNAYHSNRSVSLV